MMDPVRNTVRTAQKPGSRGIAALAIAGIVVALVGLARSAAAGTGFDARGSATYTVSRPASSESPVTINAKALFTNADSSTSSDAVMLSLAFSRRNNVEVFHRLSIRLPARVLPTYVGTSLDVQTSSVAIDYFERTRDGVSFQATATTGTMRVTAYSTGGASDLISGSFELRLEDASRGSEVREITSGTFTTDEPPSTASSDRELSPSATGGSALEDPPTAGCGGEATVSHQTDSSGCGGGDNTSDPDVEPESESGCSGDSAPSDGDSSGGCKGDSNSSSDSPKCALSSAPTGKHRPRPRSFATRMVGTFGPPFVILATLLLLRRKRRAN
jgi:hypothetical protein